MPATYYARGGARALKQMGYRYPRFLGARKTSTDQIAALAAFPIFAGESLVSLEMTGYIAAQDDHPPDNTLQHEWIVSAHPFEWASDTNSTNLTAANVGGMVEAALGSAVGSYQFGAEPNPGGDDSWSGPVDAGFGGHEILYEYPQWLVPQSDGIDTGLIAPDQIVVRAGASHRKTISKNYYWSQDMIVVVSSARAAISAQTDFGVAEIDQSADEDNLFEALGELDPSGISAQGLKAHEMIYGGDQYIEADTISTVQTRANVMVKTAIATPWPRG